MNLASFVKKLFAPTPSEQAAQLVIVAINNDDADSVRAQYADPENRKGMMPRHYYEHVETAIRGGHFEAFKALFEVVENNPFYKMSVRSHGPHGSACFGRPSFHELAYHARQKEILEYITKHMPTGTMIEYREGVSLPVRELNELAFKR